MVGSDPAARTADEDEPARSEPLTIRSISASTTSAGAESTSSTAIPRAPSAYSKIWSTLSSDDDEERCMYAAAFFSRLR